MYYSVFSLKIKYNPVAYLLVDECWWYRYPCGLFLHARLVLPTGSPLCVGSMERLSRATLAPCGQSQTSFQSFFGFMPEFRGRHCIHMLISRRASRRLFLGLHSQHVTSTCCPKCRARQLCRWGLHPQPSEVLLHRKLSHSQISTCIGTSRIGGAQAYGDDALCSLGQISTCLWRNPKGASWQPSVLTFFVGQHTKEIQQANSAHRIVHSVYTAHASVGCRRLMLLYAGNHNEWFRYEWIWWDLNGIEWNWWCKYVIKWYHMILYVIKRYDMTWWIIMECYG